MSENIPNNELPEEGNPQEISQKRERFENERMNRREALRRLGIAAGTAVFSLVTIDDLARLSADKLKEHQVTRGIGEKLAVEFRNAGVAFAIPYPSCGMTPAQTGFITCCQDRCDSAVLDAIIDEFGPTHPEEISGCFSTCMTSFPGQPEAQVDCIRECVIPKLPSGVALRVHNYLICCDSHCLMELEGRDYCTF